ncbi:MAG: hypothetical protein ACHQF3_02775 [Alphaproteobacteria bacterium]
MAGFDTVLYAGIYVAALIFLQVATWKALLFAALMGMAYARNYGRPFIIIGAVMLWCVLIATWFDAVPGPERWGKGWLTLTR